MCHNFMKLNPIFLHRVLESLFVVSIFYLLFMPQVSFAYLDPGTGSYIIQLLVAGAAGVIFTGKIFWLKITSFFYVFFGKKKIDRDMKSELEFVESKDINKRT